MALTPEQIAAALADADEAHAADERGWEPAAIDPTSIEMPNIAASSLITVRVMDDDLAALAELAAERGAAVSDLVRAAIHRYLH